MRNRTQGPLTLAAPQLIGLAIASGLQLLAPRDRRAVVGCVLFALGLIVFASQSRS